MKKIVAFLPLLALVLGANVALAHNASVQANLKADVLDSVGLKAQAHSEASTHNEQDHADNKMFVVMGTVKSVTGANIIIHAERGAHIKEQKGQDLTIKTNSESKISMNGQAVALTDIKVDSKILVKGQKVGNEFVADWIQIKNHNKGYVGEVTAVSATSITIKNNVTGNTIVIPVNGDTDVTINGETKAVTDIQVGDKGMVKVKAAVSGFFAKMIKLFR
jgi:hypothetical protein